MFYRPETVCWSVTSYSTDHSRCTGHLLDVLQTRDSLVSLVSDQNLMKRQLAETRDSLDKMAALNQSLVEDKIELNTHILQVWLLSACLSVCLVDTGSCPVQPVWVSVCVQGGGRASWWTVPAPCSEVRGHVITEGSESDEPGLQPAKVSYV